VVLHLTDNPYYLTPDITLADAIAAIDDYEQSCFASADGSHLAKVIMHNKGKVLDTLFVNLAAYVQRIADGDEATILSSGFSVTNQPAYQQKAVLAVTDGPNAGSITLTAKAVEFAVAYIWQYVKGGIPENEADWLVAGYSTSAHFDMTGLDDFTKYYFRYAAITTQGTTDFCEPVAKVIS
jgi:hypothetical protein